jgi:hypothetical protein
MTCGQCGASFDRPQNRSRAARQFCNEACAGVARRQTVDRICEHCGEGFTSTPARVADGRARFCKKQCQNAAQENKVGLTCETCGTPFGRKASAVKDRTFCTPWCEHNRHPQTITVSEGGLIGRIPLFARDGLIKAYTIIDADDVAWAAQYRWVLSTKGYVVRGQGIYLHRELLGLIPGDGVFGDHQNMTPLDNRRSNLRPTDPSESPQNTPARPGTSRHRGVSWNEDRGMWHAYANVGGIRIYSEFFCDELEAAEAARAARALYLPFATE